MALASSAFGRTSAEKLLRKKLKTGLLQVEGTLTGEGRCWHAAYQIGGFLAGYRSTGDAAYLDGAVTYFDALIAKMHTSPDGYKGWVGPYIYDKEYIADVHVGDAILINPMLDFAEAVLKGREGTVKEQYGAKAKEYVELAKKHLIEKYDRRGTWREDGPFGAYVSWDRFMTGDNLTEWRKLPVKKTNHSLPFNKQNDMAVACLKIYRVSGERRYRRKAQKIFNFLKSRLCLFEDHYVWNYWEPFGPWDVDASGPNRLVHWVNVHPNRASYQNREVAQIVGAYHTGVTFTEEDIRRIVRTNLRMWNGNEANPAWAISNYAVQKAALGRSKKRSKAACLWRSLADFDPTIRKLAGRDGRPPGFGRRHADLPVTEFKVPFASSKYFTMVAVMPSVVRKGRRSYLVSKSRVPGDVEIALHSEHGARKVADIRKRETAGGTDGRAGLLIFKWDGGGARPGAYRVRWTLKGEYREFPVRLD
jgi:hypothetical protein